MCKTYENNPKPILSFVRRTAGRPGESQDAVAFPGQGSAGWSIRSTCATARLLPSPPERLPHSGNAPSRSLGISGSSSALMTKTSKVCRPGITLREENARGVVFLPLSWSADAAELLNQFTNHSNTCPPPPPRSIAGTLATFSRIAQWCWFCFNRNDGIHRVDYAWNSYKLWRAVSRTGRPETWDFISLLSWALIWGKSRFFSVLDACHRVNTFVCVFCFPKVQWEEPH